MRYLGLAAALFLMWAPVGVAAQASMTTILTNGPASNRFNIVFLSEGYTGGQMTQFLMDATNALNALLAHQPYAEYSNYLNAFAIQTNSAQAGSDHPGAIYVNTAFNSTYDPTDDRIITIPPNFADSNYSHGQGKVDALLQAFMPKGSLAVLLVNDYYHDGGSDGFDKTAIASIGYQLPEILTHETGHVVAGLGDEYSDYLYSSELGFPNTEEPNTTQQTNRALIKWTAWISTNTPIPTAPPDSYPDVIGLFEGAHYHATNWYRPKLDCLMRDLYVPFCNVCSEAMVLAFYRKVRPVDAFSPVSTNLSATNAQALAFNLTLQQPSSNNLSVQWYTNNVVVAGATNLAYALLPRSLGVGTTGQVAAVVRDNTPLVRNDPTNLLSQTIKWTVAVNITELRLDSPLWLAGRKFAFRVTGYAPQGLVIQGSTNCLNWTPLRTNSLVAGQSWYTNTGAGAFSMRFYRALTPP